MNKSMKLSDLFDIISNAMEDGERLGIIANSEATSIIKQFLESYEVAGQFFVSFKGNPVMTKENLIMVDFTDDNFEYSIQPLRLTNGRIVACKVDYLFAFGNYKFNDLRNIAAKGKAIIETLEIDEVVEDDDEDYSDYECQCEDCNCDDYCCRDCNCENKDDDCEECCVECRHTDCEYQGNIEDCDCDKCFNRKESCQESIERYYEENGMDRDEFEAMTIEQLPSNLTQEQIQTNLRMNWYTYLIGMANGCPDCTMGLLNEFAKEIVRDAIDHGWNAHKEFMLDMLLDEE